jgi:hypothetical protein
MGTLTEALTEMRRLKESAAQWEHDKAAMAADLEVFEVQSAARLVEEPSEIEALTEQAVKLKTGLTLAQRTAATAQEQLLEAQRGVLRAHAEEHRREAARLQADADQRQARTAELVEELTAHEGCTFEPKRHWEGGFQERTRTQMTRAKAIGAEGKAVELETLADTGTAEQVAQRAARIAEQNETPALETVAG